MFFIDTIFRYIFNKLPALAFVLTYCFSLHPFFLFKVTPEIFHALLHGIANAGFVHALGASNVHFLHAENVMRVDPPCLNGRQMVKCFIKLLHRYFLHENFFGRRFRMKNAVFNTVVTIQRIVSFVIPRTMVVIVFLPLRQQKRFGNFVADLDKTIFIEKRIILAQIDSGHTANLQTARRIDSLKLPVPLACVIGQKTLHTVSLKIGFRSLCL
jgi:hypothetical protein